MRRSENRSPPLVALAVVALLGPLGCTAGEPAPWAPEACHDGVLRDRCTTLFECNPGLWGRPEHCERDLQEGTYPTSCADPEAWMACFCEASVTSCAEASEAGIVCGREHCWI